MLPQRIGRYDVSAELGRGATSIVYKGVDPATGRVVALKALQRSGDDADNDVDAIVQRFRQEARTIGRLQHPGVVAVHEFGEDGLHSWIAMEYVEGSNLDELLVRNPLQGQQRAHARVSEDGRHVRHAAAVGHGDDGLARARERRGDVADEPLRGWADRRRARGGGYCLPQPPS